MKTHLSLLFLFTLIFCNSQQITDKDAFKKCKKEFNKKTCLSDKDGDGILHYLDQCPNEAGSIENNGCPWLDTDGDGLIDKDDACPTVAGPIENNGCPWPDTDNDGILDKDDACPTVVGLPEYNGCPKKDCNENYRINKKAADDFIKLQQSINYKSIQKQLLEFLKKIKYDSSILLIINSDVFEGEGPSECPDFKFPETLNYTTESYIWDNKMLENISKTVNQNLFPASGNSLFWGKAGFYRENDEEFRNLNTEQIKFISKLTTFSDPKYGNIKYYQNKSKILSKLPTEFNRIIFEEDRRIVNKQFQTEITFKISTLKTLNYIKFKYNFETEDWVKISEDNYQNTIK